MNGPLLFSAMVAQYGTKTISRARGAETIAWSGGAHCYLPSIKFYGGCLQSGTPTPENPLEIIPEEGTWVYEPLENNEGEFTGSGYIGVPEIRGIGDYKDTYDCATGKGLRYIHKVELDGVSDGKKAIRISSEGRCDVLPEYTPVTGTKGVLSTHFRPGQSSAPGRVYARINTSTQAYELCFTLDRITMANVDAVNAWLAEQKANGTPVVIYYAMAEPIPFEAGSKTLIPNDGGTISWGGSNLGTELWEITYITHL